jgi:hypothetical protein
MRGSRVEDPPLNPLLHEVPLQCPVRTSSPIDSRDDRPRQGGPETGSDLHVLLDEPVNHVALGAMEHVATGRAGDAKPVGDVPQRRVPG